MASNSSFIPRMRNENGKRERMDQEDDPDVLPLSKRMNNIHFDGGFQTMESLPHSSSSQAHASHHHNGVPNGFTNGHLNQTFSSHQHSTNVPGVENHRSNETHNSKSYSNGIGDCQGVNGMNQNFEDRLLPGQVPPLNKIQYTPVLDQDSNPFYYESNRILFELYKERLERNNLPAHPNYGPS